MVESARKVLDLQVGDIFHATAKDIECILCLATAVEGCVVHGLDWCRGFEYAFDRATGQAITGPGIDGCFIDSVALLPDTHRIALLGMSHRYRNVQSDADLRLTEAEKQALLFSNSYYAERQLR
ncbi:hypothetical protein C0V76_19250 [Uliginosibacterium sp. TH139]|nr:hypothetical protein C0V76_19250 [Uliginosibacterium sp. TH139]